MRAIDSPQHLKWTGESTAQLNSFYKINVSITRKEHTNVIDTVYFIEKLLRSCAGRRMEGKSGNWRRIVSFYLSRRHSYHFSFHLPSPRRLHANIPCHTKWLERTEKPPVTLYGKEWGVGDGMAGQSWPLPMYTLSNWRDHYKKRKGMRSRQLLSVYVGGQSSAAIKNHCQLHTPIRKKQTVMACVLTVVFRSWWRAQAIPFKPPILVSQKNERNVKSWPELVSRNRDEHAC